MVYTYDSIMDEARKAGVLERFSQEDHNAAQKNPEYGMSLVGLLKDANNATTETQRLLATETLNQLRKSYGVMGSAVPAVAESSTAAQRLVAPKKTGTLASSDPTTYQAVLDDIVNQKDYTYDHEQDPTYKAYERVYQREGERASQNALAKAAAMTGGRPSSYAISASQQAANYYASQLADMIPTLRQNALAEHQNDIAAKYDILSALKTKEQTDYQKMLDDENRKRLEVQNALTKFQVLGYATPDVAQILGVPEGTKLGSVPVTGGNTGSTGTGTGVLTGVQGVLQNIAGAIKDKLPWNNGQTSSLPDDGEPSIANQMGGEGKSVWLLVGDSKISLEALQREVEAGRIIGKYDPASNTVTYERIPTQGMERPSIGNEKINLAMNARV